MKRARSVRSATTLPRRSEAGSEESTVCRRLSKKTQSFQPVHVSSIKAGSFTSTSDGHTSVSLKSFKGGRGHEQQLQVRKAFCRQCEQDTWSNDRTLLPLEILLWWPKTEFNKEGVKVPMGSDCGNCFHVRRRFFLPKGDKRRQGDHVQ